MDALGGLRRTGRLHAAVLGVLVLVFAWPALRMLAAVYRFDPNYSHGFLIPLLAIWMAFDQRRLLRLDDARGAGWGAAAVAGGVVLATLAHWYVEALRPVRLIAEFVWALGVLAGLVGACLALGGARLLRRLAFPLGFLVFAVPLPTPLTESVTVPLRSWVSFASARALHGLGVDVVREGNLLHLPNVTLGVEDACSGIRSLWAMMATAGVLVYVTRCGVLRAAGLGAAAVAAALLSNLLRAVVTALLVVGFGAQYVEGWRHEVCGLAAFAVGVAALVCAALALAPRRRTRSDGTPAPPEDGGLSGPVPARAALARAAAALLLAGGAAAGWIIQRHYAVEYRSAAGRRLLRDFPARIGDFAVVRDHGLTEEALAFLRPTDSLCRTYQAADGRAAALTLIYWAPSVTRRTYGCVGPHLPDACYPATGWEQLKDRDSCCEVPGASPREAQLRFFRRGEEERAVLYWCKYKQDIGLKGVTSRAAALLETWRTPRRHMGSQYIVTLEADATESAADAVRSVLDVMQLVAPLLGEYGMGAAGD